MAQRLVEVYALGDRVEIVFEIDGEEVWRGGTVVGHQHPAVWVRTDQDRKLWFVTNGRRIRPLPPPAPTVRTGG
jgi:hypothetical protein